MRLLPWVLMALTLTDSAVDDFRTTSMARAVNQNYVRTNMIILSRLWILRAVYHCQVKERKDT